MTHPLILVTHHLALILIDMSDYQGHMLGSPGLGSCKYTSEVFPYSCAQGLQNDLFSLGYLNAVLKAFSSVPFMHAAHPIHFIFKVCHFKFYEEYKLMNLQIHFFFILLFIFFFLDPFSLSNPFSQQSQGETRFYSHAKQRFRFVYLVSTLELNGSRHCMNCLLLFPI